MPSFPICHFHLKLIERVSRETKSLGVGEYKLFQRLISSLVMYHIFFYQTCWLSEPLVLSFTEVLSLTLLRTIVRGIWHLEITSKLVSMVYGMPAKGVGPKREGWRWKGLRFVHCCNSRLMCSLSFIMIFCLRSLHLRPERSRSNLSSNFAVAPTLAIHCYNLQPVSIPIHPESNTALTDSNNLCPTSHTNPPSSAPYPWSSFLSVSALQFWHSQQLTGNAN